jgi:hypothetical protein
MRIELRRPLPYITKWVPEKISCLDGLVNAPNKTSIVKLGAGHAHFEDFSHRDDLLNRGLRAEGGIFHSLNEKTLLMSRKIALWIRFKIIGSRLINRKADNLSKSHNIRFANLFNT